eukprot:CAMPEP_0117461344 /NCGR_PEP_ID=MMETSP0784-20121206/2477_1 /TAXON_ID=39447 /ORGANISM="" /LENGTH=231 /DNA_ID=CAMNT_0005255049 /DNA_START=637 /DNA_END=1329 /DNA_ORIENTATION=+
MDAFFHPNYFETNSWGKFLSTEADIVAGAPSYSVLVTSALLAFKNTTTTHELFSLWVANRCGKKDQLPLWNSLFLLWRSVIPDLEWDEALMARYNTARSHALTVANKALKSHSFAKYQRTGVLNTVQHFPFMDLHPNIGHDLMLLATLDQQQWQTGQLWSAIRSATTFSAAVVGFMTAFVSYLSNAVDLLASCLTSRAWIIIIIIIITIPVRVDSLPEVRVYSCGGEGDAR